ncbi:hypothetical protein ABZ865_16645 [Streptomyces sp. NPDC047085]|uniref:hypothetical protein n=1 Tax=Streptomyces sp. NPDC047085 TaxID=3155140 RepID=UPI003400E8AF
MSDQNGHPQSPDPRAWAVPPQTQTPTAPQQPAVPQLPVPPQALQASRAWIDGYEPGNPWQTRLCLDTPYGTVAYPLTPHTIPDLLEPLVLVAQEQQGLPVGLDAAPEPAETPDQGADEDGEGLGARFQNGRAARLTGWAVVHDLWEREDPTARIVMGAIVVGLLLLGIVLT